MNMLLRRHRASLHDVDPAFDKTPHETVDPAFNDPNLASGEEAEEQVKDVAPDQSDNPDLGPLGPEGEVRDDEEAEGEPVDPADLTVDQVIEYLDTAIAEDREAILKKERSGKARKGILERFAPAEDLF